MKREELIDALTTDMLDTIEQSFTEGGFTEFAESVCRDGFEGFSTMKTSALKQLYAERFEA